MDYFAIVVGTNFKIGKRKENVIAKYFVMYFSCARSGGWKKGFHGVVKGFEL